MKDINIVIVDDQQIIRLGFASLLAYDRSLKIIGEATDGENGYDVIRNNRPDIAVIDINLPRMRGLQLAKIVKKEFPYIQIVILTVYEEEEYFREAMEIGVSGYFIKDETDDLVNSLKKIYEGETILSPKVHKYVSKLYINRSKKSLEKPELTDLTHRELEILVKIAENKSNQEIANEFFIDKRTVETHRNNIREKLDLKGKSRNALLLFALQNKTYIDNILCSNT